MTLFFFSDLVLIHDICILLYHLEQEVYIVVHPAWSDMR